MKTFGKLIAGAALASGAALLSLPANAGITIGIGLGGPGPNYHDWCYHHPYRCGHYGEYYGPPPGEGAYVNGYGYWGAGHWWHHREWRRDHWRYW